MCSLFGNRSKSLFAFALTLLLSSCLSLCLADNFGADLEALAARAPTGPLLDEDQTGYDKHADIFYYSDDNVAKEFARTNYKATQITLAGQAPDFTGRPVAKAVNPFAVGQRTFKCAMRGFEGTLKDRWDVKESADETQYLGLYHGKGSDYVVNKVRAHLLRQLANAVNDQVPTLDRTAEEDASDQPELVEQVQEEVRATVERVYREVDDSIRQSMDNLDDSKASATVVIVTKNYLVTIAVGHGTVVAYDDDFEVKELVAPYAWHESNLFGVKRSRKQFKLMPRVEFFSRVSTNYQFFLMETQSLAATVDKKTAVKAVVKSVELHKKSSAQEQELYSSALTKVLDAVENSKDAFYRSFLHSDYSVMLVGLETNYNDIH